MTLAMTRPEREAFLLAHHTGVMVVAGAGGQLFATPVWYDYQPGGTIGFVLNDGAIRLAAIDAGGCSVGLTVHDDTMPPAYVTVFGSVVVNRQIEPDDLARVWPSMVHALGGEEVATRYVSMGADPYLRGEAAQPTSGGRRIEVEPARWASVDYSKAGDRIRSVMEG